MITPKLHLLEDHLIPSVRHVGVGFGLLGEQGGEAIHRRFNELESRFFSITTSEQLCLIVKQHLTSTIVHLSQLIVNDDGEHS